MAPKSKRPSSSRGSCSGSGDESSCSGLGQDDEYRMKRERNNVAVKKSREKSRQHARETMERVGRLKQENAELEQKVKLLSKELGLLKDLLVAHAGTVSEGRCVGGDVKPSLGISGSIAGGAVRSGIRSGANGSTISQAELLMMVGNKRVAGGVQGSITTPSPNACGAYVSFTCSDSDYKPVMADPNVVRIDHKYSSSK